MSTWLDTETKAILQKEPPGKLAPAEAAPFGLVLLTKGNDRDRTARAITRIVPIDSREAGTLLEKSCPLTVRTQLTLEDALLGQFELACCDAVSVFLREEVVADNDQAYLGQLYDRILNGREFEEVSLTLISAAQDPSGDRFLDQFLGSPAAIRRELQQQPGLPLRMIRRKAKLMNHWAEKIVDMSIVFRDTTLA